MENQNGGNDPTTTQDEAQDVTMNEAGAEVGTDQIQQAEANRLAAATLDPSVPQIAPTQAIQPSDEPAASPAEDAQLEGLVHTQTVLPLKKEPSSNTNVNVSTPLAQVTSVNDVPDEEPLPLKASSHGAPARRYLNEKVTAVLLEGMKRLALEQPEQPLKVLGEYLLKRSKEIEE